VPKRKHERRRRKRDSDSDKGSGSSNSNSSESDGGPPEEGGRRSPNKWYDTDDPFIDDSELVCLSSV